MRPWPAVVLLAACSPTPPAPATVRARIQADLGAILTQTKAAADQAVAALPGLGTFGLSIGMLALDPDHITQVLTGEVFADASYRGDGIYEVPAAVVCGDDAGCAQRLPAAALRVRVEQDGDALRFTLQVDAAHDEPVAFTLSPGELAVSLDLDGSTQAMVALAELAGETAPSATLSGEVSATLELLGDAHVRATLTFDRAISVAVADQGGDPAMLTSARGDALSVELGAATTVQLGLGQTTLHVPATATAASTDLVLPGATGSVVVQDQTLTFDGLSLGNQPVTIAKNGFVAIALALDPDDGGAVSGTVIDTAGTSTLAVSPRLDVRQAIDHTKLGDAPPVYDVTRMLLDGMLAGPDGGDMLDVTSGTFSIATDPASYGFTAAAGSCVTRSAATDPASGASFTQYAVTACQ